MALSSKIQEVRDALKTLLQGISGDIGSPHFVDTEPSEKGWNLLPVVFIAAASAQLGRLTNATVIYSLDFVINYFYSEVPPGDRRHQAWDAAATIAEKIQSDPSLGGLVVGIDGDIGIRDSAVEFGIQERFLTGIQLTVTYVLTPFEK